MLRSTYCSLYDKNDKELTELGECPFDQVLPSPSTPVPPLGKGSLWHLSALPATSGAVAHSAAAGGVTQRGCATNRRGARVGRGVTS